MSVAPLSPASGVSATLPQALKHCSVVPMSVVSLSSASGVSATLPQALEHCSGVPMCVVRISSALKQALKHHLASSMAAARLSHLP